ncbi:uncharacterized protein LOC128880109 [Hylaeus volcanicus]|uniref:uncharacterized protein LOC128880109 n=1 Tax=Hylaeus volcanicus TaxID=313075 RepID=UPI0023B83262|nr:uncharacterized protein LOC128880109 [Hylaeus volcanicus]
MYQPDDRSEVNDDLSNHLRLISMTRTKELTKMTPKQAQEFLDSFDIVLSDCDGVLWRIMDSIPGALHTMSRLQDIGKKTYLVTNNSTLTFDQYYQKINKFGLELKPEQVILPSKVVGWYLNKINFRGEVFLIGSAQFRQVLLDHGIKLTPECPDVQECDPVRTVKAVQDRPSIKAVVVDFSLFFDWAKLALAVSCLKRKDVLYMVGALDEWLVCGHDRRLIGPGHLTNIITKVSERTPIECAKPSNALKEFVMDKCEVRDPKRCLFIGDTITHDMKFATVCGFQKLFVNTGVDKIEDALQCEEAEPDYYIPSLGLLYPIIDSLYGDSAKQKHS